MAQKTDHERSFDRGDELLSRVMGETITEGETAYDLLTEFQRGYPVSKLRLLLNASNRDAVAAGTWIASELAISARPLFNDVVNLLHYPFAYVRFFALEYILSCVRPEDEDAISTVLDLVEDPEHSVRWLALTFLAMAPAAILRAAMAGRDPADRHLLFWRTASHGILHQRALEADGRQATSECQSTR